MSGRRSRFKDAPLLAWGEALRLRKEVQRRRRLRFFLVGLGAGLVLGSAILPPTPRLLWNASASAPIGLYQVSPGAPVMTGDMVVARPDCDLFFSNHGLPPRSSGGVARKKHGGGHGPGV